MLSGTASPCHTPLKLESSFRLKTFSSLTLKPALVTQELFVVTGKNFSPCTFSQEKKMETTFTLLSSCVIAYRRALLTAAEATRRLFLCQTQHGFTFFLYFSSQSQRHREAQKFATFYKYLIIASFFSLLTTVTAFFALLEPDLMLIFSAFHTKLRTTTTTMTTTTINLGSLLYTFFFFFY